MKHSFSIAPASVVALLLLVPSLAHAHTGFGPTTGLGHGFTHPLCGLDHILAMLAVGLWATQMGGRSVWVVPLAFISLMSVGGIMGATGHALPFTEMGIVMSVLILGVLIVSSTRSPLVASATIVGLFAIFH